MRAISLHHFGPASPSTKISLSTIQTTKTYPTIWGINLPHQKSWHGTWLMGNICMISCPVRQQQARKLDICLKFILFQ